MTTKPYISVSQMNKWFRCKRLWYYSNNYEKLVTKLSPAIKMGRLWDAFLQLKHGQATQNELNTIIDDYEISLYDVARVRALAGVYNMLIEPETTDICQTKLSANIDDKLTLLAIPDRINDPLRYFVESKLTKYPNDYTTNYFYISPQIIPYFIALDKCRYTNIDKVIMEVTRTPQQKIEQPNKTNKRTATETPEEFEARITKDIISRPSYYFIGLDRKKKKFGKVFPKSLFNLTNKTFEMLHIRAEMEDCADNMFKAYKEHRCLEYYQQCDFFDACVTGCVDNEEIYRKIGL